ncbi:hypothetical protein ScPMuIL_000083 [Solemya velum]
MADLVDQNLEDSLMESKGCDDEKEEQFGNDETRQLDVKTFVNSTCAWEESQLFVHNNENHVNSFDHGKSSLNAESECSEDVPLDYMTQNAMSTICCLSQTECMPTDEFKIKMLFKSQRDEPPKQDKISIGRFSPNNNSRQQTIDVRNPSSQNKGYESHPCDNSILEISSKQSMEETIVDDIVLCCDRLNDLAVSGGVCSPLHLDDLPVEVLMYIFSFLDARFILRTLSKEACIQREEKYKIWTNVETSMDHFTYNEGLFAPVDAVHLMQNGQLLASGSRDRYLTLLDLTKYNPNDPDSKKEMAIHSDSKAHKGWIWSLASIDATLATGSWDTYIKLWDLDNNCTEVSKFKCKSAILDLYIEPGLIIAGGYNKQVYQIDPREGQIRCRKAHAQPVLCIAVDDNYIITGSEDRTVVIYDRRGAEIFKTLEVESFVMDMCFAEGQLWLGDKKGNASLFDASHSQFEFVQKYDMGYNGKLTGIIYTLGALFTCSTDHTIKVSEPNMDPAHIRTLKTHNGDVAQVRV